MKFSKKCISVFLVSLLATSSLGVNASAATKPQLNDKNKAKMMNQYINELNKQYPFSGAILVSQKGKTIFKQSYGKANSEKNIPNTTDTKFSLASVSKQFTAAGIMILQERGKLNVKDPIKKYLPDYKNGDKITIENLLTHTSGIPDYVTDEFNSSKESKKSHTPEELINLFKDKSLVSEPGTKFQYCNSNYVLLGYIIEKVSGMKFEEFLKNNIFKPLKMKNTGFYLDSANVKNKASSYTRTENGIKNILDTHEYVNLSSIYAAGGMYSTVDDLYLWHRALSDEKILKKKSLDQMYTQFLPSVAYGYGVGLDNMNNQKCISHIGGLPGISTALLRFIDEDTCIVILANIAPADVLKIQSNLYSILHEGKYEKPEQFKKINLDSKVLDSYVGKYEIAPGIGFEIVKGDSCLSLISKTSLVAHNEVSIIYPCSQTKFFHQFQLLNVEFKDIENGKAQKATLNNGGMIGDFKRIN